jgi:hypothetical protein
MFDLIYEIWCITDAFFAQFIVLDDSQDNNSIDDDDLPDGNLPDGNGDNLYNGDLDNSVTQS